MKHFAVSMAHPTADIKAPSLVFNHEGKYFLIGRLSEGIQRCAAQNQQKITNVTQIFLTGRVTWESLGGLPGFILTVSNQSFLQSNIDIYHGSPLIYYLTASWRYFIFRFACKLNIFTIGMNKEVNCYNDKDLKIESVITYPDDDNESVNNNESTEDMSFLKKIISSILPKSNNPILNGAKTNPTTNEKIDPPQTDNSSTSYILNFHPTRNFLPQKAKELGVPRGPLYGILSKGTSITLEDGRIIEPTQVLSPMQHMPKVLVIDCPGKEYVLGIVSNQQWPKDDVDLIYHILDESVEPFEEPYLSFIKSFGLNCKHQISHPLYCPNTISIPSASIMMLKLKALLKDNFTIPLSSGAVRSLVDDLKHALNEDNDPRWIENIRPLLSQTQFTLEKDKKVTMSKRDPNLDTGAHDYEKDMKEFVAPLNLEQSIRPISPNDSSKSSHPLHDKIEILTLGTGSSMPSKYRNVSSTIVRLPYEDESGILTYRSVILDCGENTLGTMKRLYGDDGTNKLLSETKLLYLSHLHADHHLGYISIIKEMIKLRKQNKIIEHDTDKIYILGPFDYYKFLKEYNNIDKDSLLLENIVYINCEDFMFSSKTKKSSDSLKTINELKRDLDFIDILTCRAIHCDQSYCVTINSSLSKDKSIPNFKYSFSGDTRPSKYFAIIGKNSDLLIHEATFSDDKLLDALDKRHSTIGEAIYIGEKMHCKNIVLTHISQRYSKTNDLSIFNGKVNDNEKLCTTHNNLRELLTPKQLEYSPDITKVDYSGNIAMAFDGMSIFVGDIYKQKYVVDGLQLAFPEEDEADTNEDDHPEQKKPCKKARKA